MQPASGGPSDPPRVPPYLATKRRRWLSLVVLCAALAVANGPVLCWQTLVPIMVESEGAFRGHDPIAHLDLIFAIGNGLGSITNLPSGMIYDRIGPRRTAVIGALLTSIGLAGLGLCLQYPWANGGMYVFYPAATIFAFLNSWGAFAYLWLLPESPALVNACICAAFSLSDTLGLVAAQLHRKHGLALHDFFYILGAGAVGAAVVSALLLPGRDEFRRLVCTPAPPHRCTSAPPRLCTPRLCASAPLHPCTPLAPLSPVLPLRNALCTAAGWWPTPSKSRMPPPPPPPPPPQERPAPRSSRRERR